MADNPDGKWVIRRKGQPNDYWSVTQNGWAAYDEATLFTDEDKVVHGALASATAYWSRTHRKSDA